MQVTRLSCQQRADHSTSSTIPLPIIPGNKRPAESLPFTPVCIVHTTFGRIERDSQSWTKRRSSSNHCPWTGPPVGFVVKPSVVTE